MLKYVLIAPTTELAKNRSGNNHDSKIVLKKLTPGYWVNFVAAAICLGVVAGLIWHFLITDKNPSEAPAPEILFGNSWSKQPSPPVGQQGPEAIFSVTWSEYRPPTRELRLNLLTDQEISHCQVLMSDLVDPAAKPDQLRSEATQTMAQTGCIVSIPVAGSGPLSPQSQSVTIVGLDNGAKQASCTFVIESIDADPTDPTAAADIVWRSEQGDCDGNGQT